SIHEEHVFIDPEADHEPIDQEEGLNYEEEYLDDDGCPSLPGSIFNENYDEEYLEEEHDEDNLSNNDPQTSNLKNALRIWFIKNKISRRAGNDLLSILRNNVSACNLPQDMRTILKPPRKVCYFNGVHGCQKCKCRGIVLKTPRKVIFEDIGAEDRTDEDFRNECCSINGHRRGPTPLLDLKHFDIIKQVP
uniref:Uncharacterized protein n=1 Tax=Anopheles dirus TaxID=7168 RepID=A0A182NMY8_9DIPT